MFMRNENGSHGKNITSLLQIEEAVSAFTMKSFFFLRGWMVEAEDSDSVSDLISIGSDKPTSKSRHWKGPVAGWMRLVRSAHGYGNLLIDLEVMRKDESAVGSKSVMWFAEW